MPTVVSGRLIRHSNCAVRFTADELICRPLIDFVHPDDRQATSQAFGRLIEGSDVGCFDFRWRCKDGSYRPLEWNCSVPSTGEELIHAVARDTQRQRSKTGQGSDAKRIEELERCLSQRNEELKRARTDLQCHQRLADLGRVAGGIAHELRNPLNAAKMSVYYLLHTPNLGLSKTREHLRKIERQVALASDTISSLLDFARRPTPMLAEVDLDKCLSDVIADTMLPSSVRVEVKLAHPLPPVLADQVQVRIAIGNLIRNAGEATPAGGIINVRARRRNHMVEVSVTDHGDGIPDVQLENVCQPFNSSKADGVGLGLTITETIVERNRGQLRVESEIGKGSTFTIALPAAARKSGQGEGN